MARRDTFTAIHTEGPLLPPDLLRRIADGDRDVGGLTPDDYHLPGEKINEAITRAWNRAVAAWANLKSAVEKLPPGDPGTTVTRERWLLPLFQELGYGRLQTVPALELDGRSFPLSHGWGHVPIHLVGWNVDLDTRTRGVAGAARTSPHGLLQEALNKSDAHLWGFLSNGRRLRLLRDNSSLTRQAYLEFDLETMLEGEDYADFVLLWLLCHQSRVESERPEECRLEKWSQFAQQQGIRALEGLRRRVEEAITALGAGFLAHPANEPLRARLRAGSLSAQDYYRQVLRLVYRLIFLFAAEDRELLLDPEGSDEAKDRYLRFYSTRRLRRLAERRRGTPHPGLWRALSVVFAALSAEEPCPALALRPLGSFLWSAETAPDLAGCDLHNRDLLVAVRSLAFTVNRGALRPVDYRNLGAEELGSVYESLLELHPEVNLDVNGFLLGAAGGSERKTTGSYYTPTSLISCLLDSALDPVLDEAVQKPRPQEALLALKVCDPACGSGHFLVAAARRIAKRLAAVGTGDDEPSPEAAGRALRQVIGRCIHGVDINSMAVELCKVNLWMEAMEPGKPLSFLDHHIRVGNSLLGATPELIAAGIPDEAFAPIGDDDGKACAELKRRNRGERDRWGPLFAQQDAESQARLQRAAAALETMPDDRPEDIRARALASQVQEQNEEYRQRKQLADAWCAAFVIPKHFPPDPDNPRFPSRVPFGISTAHLLGLADGRKLPAALDSEVECLSRQYQFLHWHMAFAEVFAGGGFDCVLGNPPWEKINLKLEEYFALRRPEIALAGTKARRAGMLQQLLEEDPEEYAEYASTARFHEGLSHYFRSSNAFPATGVSRINLYSLFAERGGQMLSSSGRLGMLFPTGIATDQNNKDLFFGLARDRRLVGLFDFENRGPFFPDVHRQFRFALLVFAGSAVQRAPRFGFFLTSTADVADPSRVFELTPDDLRLLSPESGTAPIFRNPQEAILARAIYRRHRALAGWAESVGTPQTPFNMANDSHLFLPRDALRAEPVLPLVEGKHIGPFNWRAARGGDDSPGNVLAASADNLFDPNWVGVVRHYLPSSVVQERYPAAFRVVLRTITNATNERTAIAAITPPVAVGHTLIQFRDTAREWCYFLVSSVNSFAFDFITRIRMSGTSLTHWIVRQIPLPSPQAGGGLVTKQFIDVRSVELSLNDTWLASALEEHGQPSGPFRWDEERRFALRCELDAAFLHLYLPADVDGSWLPAHGETAKELTDLKSSFPIPRDAAAYILDTFPIVKRRDEAQYGEFRTKRAILEIYDGLADAIRTGQPYQTRLDPPPADPRCCHPSCGR